MYNAVIIGSGYGGSPMAARLAGSGKILLVERGKRWKAGDFNQTLLGTARHYRTKKNPLGLWEFRIGKGVGVAFASALGGASKVNYGITVQPEDHVFLKWPLDAEEMKPYYQRVREMIQPSFHPKISDFEEQKFINLVEPGKLVDLENTIYWDKCTDCGHCAPGCNEGAKRDLEESYLKKALEGGVDFLLETEAVDLQKTKGGYALKLRRTGSRGKVQTILTRQVVLSGGTFGTLDLLYRWRKIFQLSPTFGQTMSMNGDGLAFLYNTGHPLSTHLGAPITTSARLTLNHETGPRTLTVMSGRIPASVLRFASAAMVFLAPLIGEGPSRVTGGDSRIKKWQRSLKDLLLGPKDGGALAQTYMYKLDGQDGSGGRARFDYLGRSVMDWPDYLKDPIMEFAAEKLREWGKKMGGQILPNLARLPFMKSFGVHPLGGCRMGEDFDEGVTDSYGRIHRPEGGFYEGIRIADASLLPSSLGVPPSFTVAALSERVAEHMVEEGV